MTLPQQDSSELRNDALLARTSTLRRRVLAAAVSGIFAASFVAFSTVASGNPPPSDVGIKTLSARADLVSGGDALVQITLKHENRNHPVTITLNGHDVTSAFRPGDTPDTLIGLVTGLNLGKNALRVQGNGSSGLKDETLEITNYPITGPIISGPHEVPYICTTQNFQIYSGILGPLVPGDTTTFGPSLDANCSAATKITYLYMPVGGTAFVALPSTSSLPANVAKTTTTTGATVNFVVRVETSTINRGIYQSTILHDPTSDPAPSWFSPPRGWNKRLIAIEGAGCPGGWYIQGTVGGSLSLAGVIDASLFSPARLGQGYALFGNTLQNASQSCNSVLSGETAMMGKEHFIESFGVPLYTVSMGASGGSYGSSQLVDALPGLFDGVLISAVFPDPLGIAFSGSDGHLLTHYFNVTDPAGFSVAQQVAVSGYKGLQAFIDAANQSGRIDPVPGRVDIPGYNSAVWNPVVPVSLRYDPVTHPLGARPTLFDVSRNMYGVNPTTGFALRPVDNVGVQYGLAALNAGQITTTQFLNLNEFIGGYDQDFNYVPNRAVGNTGAILRGQQSGLQLGGNGGLASIPVFDFGAYNDTNGYHYQWFHFAMRDRMAQANGNADNHVMWRGNAVPFETAFSTFVQWVEAVAADDSDRSQREKVIADKPPMAVDGCWSSTTNFIAEPQTFGRLPNSQCNTLFPSYAFPRYVAGGPLAANKMKCQLKLVDLNDYQVNFTSAELTHLHNVFPNGVCDWSKPGVNQTGVVTWASFGPSPDNLVFDITK
jgi:hypothetical protein